MKITAEWMHKMGCFRIACSTPYLPYLVNNFIHCVYLATNKNRNVLRGILTQLIFPIRI